LFFLKMARVVAPPGIAPRPPVSESRLSDKLQLAGWRISRSGVSKIERGLIYVHDFQLFYVADVLGVQVPALFPKIDIQSDRPLDRKASLAATVNDGI
jgi:transcriptional regulator with XRE-family HTH domain